MEALSDTVDQKLRDTQTWKFWLFDARLRKVADDDLLNDLVFIETTLADQTYKSTSVASGPFLVVAVDPHTVPIQRINSSGENISRSCL